MRIKVTDSFGASDSLRLFLKSPWLALDTGANKAYTLAKNFLRDSIFTHRGPREDRFGLHTSCEYRQRHAAAHFAAVQRLRIRVASRSGSVEERDRCV